MNIVGIKLVTNEEIISEIEFMPDGRFLLTNPVRLQMYPPQVAGGQPNIGFAPFPTFAAQKADNKVKIEPLHVVYTYTPDDQLISQYNSIFGSGIITPPVKQIITG